LLLPSVFLLSSKPISYYYFQHNFEQYGFHAWLNLLSAPHLAHFQISSLVSSCITGAFSFLGASHSISSGKSSHLNTYNQIPCIAIAFANAL
jgi:hypothetical protein